MHTEIEVPAYRERTISDSRTIPARMREKQDRIIHGELIHRRKLIATRMEAPLTKILPPLQ